MQQLMETIASFDWSPFWISLKTGIVSTILAFFLGIYAARQAMRLSAKTRAVMDGLLTLPMVVAPTVVGFFLLLLFSLKRPVGSFLYDTFHLRVVQTWLGCIIAALVISFPLMYRNARSAFEQVDPDLIDAGRALGMSEIRIFWQVVLPTAGPGVASGTVMTFARARGEYGATSMLAGNIANKTGTISQRIALVMKNGDYWTAGIWCLVMLVIALVILIAINLISSKGMKRFSRW